MMKQEVVKASKTYMMAKYGKSLDSIKEIHFLTKNILLHLYWFQPYTHTQTSIGVIYLTVLNLPRYLRYKRENVILVGIIPGPNEPKGQLIPFYNH